MGKRTTGNARKRVKAVAAQPARAAKPTLVQRIQRLETEQEVATAGRRELWRIVRALLERADKDREEALQQLAAALERIGWMEQRWRDRDAHEKARVRRDLEERLAASAVSAINVSAPPRRFARLRRVLAHLLTPTVIALTAAIALAGVLTWVWRMAFLR
jgi:hypothetical protein